VGGFLGIGDKYVAVPPSAFSIAPDQSTLVLNADKAKIQNAPSFAKSSWPDLNSAAWRTESDYWLSGGTAQGTVGTTTSGTASERLDQNRLNSSSTVEPHTGATSSRFGDHSTTAGNQNMFHGKIIAISPEGRTLTVQGTSGTREFKLSDQPTLTLKENRAPRITDFKVGYPVNVGYHEVNGAYVADSLSRTDTPEVR